MNETNNQSSPCKSELRQKIKKILSVVWKKNIKFIKNREAEACFTTCLCVCLFVCLCVLLYISVSVSLSLSLHLLLCLLLWQSVSVSVSFILRYVYFFGPCLWMSVSFILARSLFLFYSLSLLMALGFFSVSFSSSLFIFFSLSYSLSLFWVLL